MKDNLRLSLATCALFALGSLMVSTDAAAQVPEEWSFSGILHENGSSFDGVVEAIVEVWDAEYDGTLLWSESHAIATVVGGYFNLR